MYYLLALFRKKKVLPNSTDLPRKLESRRSQNLTNSNPFPSKILNATNCKIGLQSKSSGAITSSGLPENRVAFCSYWHKVMRSFYAC